MLKKTSFLIILVICTSLLLAACQLLPQTVAPQNPAPDAADTAVARTVVYELTRSAFKTLAVQVTQALQPTQGQQGVTVIPVVVTATPIPPTQTPYVITATPKATTAVPAKTQASSTKKSPTKTGTPKTQTPTPEKLCNQMQFIKDVTVADGKNYTGGTAFKKTWRVKNIGTCTWNTSYELVFSKGNNMGPDSVKLADEVKPGNEADISVDLVAPTSSGSYTGYYMLKNDKGVLFGWGENASKSIWVKIVVGSPTPAPTSNGNSRDFANDFCRASWSTDNGDISCPSSSQNFTNGSVTYTSSPKLETGATDDEATLILIPNNGADGYIKGVYPTIKVKTGENFTAVIGCLYDRPKCSVRYTLKYKIKGEDDEHELDSWEEDYNEEWQRVNVDLNSLVGKSVHLIFLVENLNDSSKDDAFFIMAPKVYTKK
jgi:hypothetical protein